MQFVGRPNNIITVDTIAQMTAMTKPLARLEVIVNGYSTIGDGGGGEFYWDVASTATANGGTIFASDAGGTGRFLSFDSGSVNVLRFGAVGDGVADDTAEIQAALDTDRDVEIPLGKTFLVDGDLRNGTNFQRIYGGGCIKKKAGNVKPIFYLLDESDGVHFDNIEIDGTLASFTVGNATPAILGYLAKSLTVTNCYLRDNADAGIKLRDSAGLIAIGNRFYKTKNNGIELRSYINDPRTGSPYVGTRPEIQGNIKIVGNHFNRIDDGGHGAGDGCGITFDSVNGSYPYKNVTIEGNTFVDTLRCIWTENNITGSEAVNVSIVGNTLLGCVSGAGTIECKDGIGLIGIKGAVISGNTIRNISNIVSVGDTTGITISGSLGVTVVTDVTITNNIIIDDTAAANRNDYGIRVTLGDGLTIYGNRISGASIAQISIAASNTSDIDCYANPGAELDYSWSQIWTTPFWKDNLAASSTHNLAPSGWAGDYEIPMPCNGVLVGVTARLSAAISAGTITIKSYTNSVERTNLQVVNADFGGGAIATKTIASQDGVVVTQGQRIRVEAVTDGSWLPTTDDLFVSLTFDIGKKK
jgi:hypothetical protein